MEKQEVKAKLENKNVVFKQFLSKTLEYSIALVFDKELNQNIHLKGKLNEIEIEEEVQVTGIWKQDVNNKDYFSVFKYKVIENKESMALVNYLSAINGIGPSYAKRIVDHFQAETLKVIDKTPDKLLEVNGIGEKKIDSLLNSWDYMKAIRPTIFFLYKYDIRANTATKIYRLWGDSSKEKIINNPYSLTEIDGIGFVKADHVANSMGFPLNSPYRIEAGVVYTLQQAKRHGHCYLPLSDLLAETRKNLDLENKSEEIRDLIFQLAKNNKLVFKQSIHGQRNIYLPYIYKAEKQLSNRIKSLLESPNIMNLPENLDFPDSEYKLTNEQKTAIKRVVVNKISIITGGPGTGKSTLTKVLCDLLNNYNKKVILAAPTGKAAKKIAEITGHESTTIHRLLGYGAYGYLHNQHNPIEADVIVVDEASMLDLLLANSLFDAIDNGANVVLIGDIDQLPSVGIGKILQDLLVSRSIITTKLGKIFRQAKRSMIIQAAYAVNSGRLPEKNPEKASKFLSKGDEIIHDYFFLPINDNELIKQKIIDYTVNRIPRKSNYNPINDIQVLAPQSSGILGTESLNLALQEKLNPKGVELENKKHFRVGDKLLNNKNNYTHQIMNGEFAVIKKYNPVLGLATLETDDAREVEIGIVELNDHFSLAYAVTIHKMQGSSAKAIVLPITMSYYQMLNRNLIYTAITRAEKMCLVIGQEQAMAAAVKNNEVPKRNSALAESLLNPSLTGQLF